MRKIILSSLVIILSIVFQLEWASSAPTFTSNPPLESCLQDTKKHTFSGNIGNTYSWWLSQEKLSDFYMAFSKDICWFYVFGGIMVYIHVWKIFPVYLPTKDTPIGVYTIYLGQDYTMYWTGAFYPWAYYMASYKKYNYTWKSPMPPWFRGWRYHISGKSNNETYLISLTEPFVSAPMIQMYNYLWHPLLVARSSTWVVTDVYFQNRPYIENPMERAKKFLWKKWYNP